MNVDRTAAGAEPGQSFSMGTRIKDLTDDAQNLTVCEGDETEGTVAGTI